MSYMRSPPRPRHLLRVPAPNQRPGAKQSWYALVELLFEQRDGRVVARRKWELRWKKNPRAKGYKFETIIDWHYALPSLEDEVALLPKGEPSDRDP